MVKVGRPRLRRMLKVWMNGQCVGRWSVSAQGVHSLTYAADWLLSPQARPLSLSLPLSAAGRSHRGARVQVFFDNLLPAAPLARQRLQSLFGVASPTTFDLLCVLGRDCPGAAQLTPDDATPGDPMQTEGEPLSERDLTRMCDALAADPGAAPAPDARLARAALAETQPATALLWHQGRWCLPQGASPSTHVLKLPLGAQPGGASAHSTSLENEWLCARLLAAFGFEVAPQRIEAFGAHKLLVTERIDRRWVDAHWWARLPLEDLCQATGTAPHQAAEAAGGPGLARLLDLLRGSDEAARDRERLLAAALVMWMLAVPELSAKRFALLLRPAGHFVLAPLSGVMSAWPVLGRHPSAASLQRLRLGLSPSGAVLSHDQVTLARWQDAARRSSMGAGFAAVIDGLARWTDNAIETVAAELPRDFPASVSGAVFDGLRRSARALSVQRAA
jgi:serine/threonine-protein kinase HipA